MIARLLDVAFANAIAALVLGAVVFAIARLASRRPALVHALWVIVLARLVAPPLLEIDLGVDFTAPTRAETPADPPMLDRADDADGTAEDLAAWLAFAESLATRPPIEDAALRTSSADAVATDESRLADFGSWTAAGLWLSGTLGIMSVAWQRTRRFRALLRAGERPPRRLLRRLALVARRLGLARFPRPLIVNAPVSPMLWGFGARAVLILPKQVLEALDQGALDTLLAHELAHFRRRDHCLRPFEFLVGALWWWHPAVWLARRELHRAEEECCDAWVLTALPGHAKNYAMALLQCIDHVTSTTRPSVAPAASAMSAVGDLKRRIERIMTAKTPNTMGRPARLCVAALALSVLPLLPTSAQDGDQPASPDGDSGSLATLVIADEDTSLSAPVSDAAALCDEIEKAILGLERLLARAVHHGDVEARASLEAAISQLKQYRSLKARSGDLAIDLSRIPRTDGNLHPHDRAHEQQKSYWLAAPQKDGDAHPDEPGPAPSARVNLREKLLLAHRDAIAAHLRDLTVRGFNQQHLHGEVFDPRQDDGRSDSSGATEDRIERLSREVDALRRELEGLIRSADPKPTPSADQIPLLKFLMDAHTKEREGAKQPHDVPAVLRLLQLHGRDAEIPDEGKGKADKAAPTNGALIDEAKELHEAGMHAAALEWLRRLAVPDATPTPSDR